MQRLSHLAEKGPLRAVQIVAGRLLDRPGIIEEETLPLYASGYLPDAVGEFALRGSAPVPSEMTESALGESELDDTFQPETWHTLGSVLRRLRRNKHADEVATLERAMRACAAGHAAALATVAPGVTEFEVYQAIHAAVLAEARHPVQIYGDFRSTNRTTPKRGGAPTDQVLAAGDLLLLDYSVIVDGYRSDFTNTVCAGPPSAEVQRMFHACHEALQAGAAALRPGARAVDIYETVAGPLRQSGWQTDRSDVPAHPRRVCGWAQAERELNDRTAPGSSSEDTIADPAVLDIKSRSEAHRQAATPARGGL